MSHQLNHFTTEGIDNVASLFSVTVSQNLDQVVVGIFGLGQVDCVTLEFIEHSILNVLRSLFKQALDNTDRVVSKDQLNDC